MGNKTTLKRDGAAYILTVFAENSGSKKTRIRIESNGRMHDLSGAAVSQSDVNIAVLHFRTIGASGMIENILKWWERQ